MINLPTNKSITRYPSYYKVESEFLENIEDKDSEWYVVDCPGFEDTAGIIVEIANRITTIEALRTAAKISLVPLINFNNWGAKGEQVKVLIETISSLTRSYSSVKSGISFIFNNFTTRQLEQLNINLKDLHMNVRAQSKDFLDENFHLCFDHLKKVT